MAVTKHKSVSVSQVGKKVKKRKGEKRKDEKDDERVVRTRRQVDAAFVELLHRRAYGNIRVSDIAKKAGVGRATFYAHYPSKDELLLSQFNRFVAPMLAIRQSDACPLDATALFIHVQSVPRFYKALISGPDAGGGPKVLRDCIEERVRQALESQSDSAGPEAGFEMHQATVKRAVASSLLAVIECWIENNMNNSPQEVQTIFRKLVGGGLTALRRGI
jgi:AcrR family transcriptional regulator